MSVSEQIQYHIWSDPAEGTTGFITSIDGYSFLLKDWRSGSTYVQTSI